MTVILCVLMGIVGFLSGFLTAVLYDIKPHTKRHTVQKNKELEQLHREYSNFLNYDGTEQL